MTSLQYLQNLKVMIESLIRAEYIDALDKIVVPNDIVRLCNFKPGHTISNITHPQFPEYKHVIHEWALKQKLHVSIHHNNDNNNYMVKVEPLTINS